MKARSARHDDKRSLSAQGADEEAEFEYDVIPRYTPFRAPDNGYVVGSEDEYARIERRPRRLKGLENVLRRLEKLLRPDRHIGIALDVRLDGIRQVQVFPRACDEQAGLWLRRHVSSVPR